MLFRLLFIVLITIVSLFAKNAESSGSRFIAQTDLDYSRVNVYRKYSFNGNGDIWIQFGREFRFVKQRISLTPSIGLNRNGWSFVRKGRVGSISYIAPYISAALGLHPGKAFLDIGIHYGGATYAFGEIDGKSSTENNSYFTSFSLGLFTHVGVDFFEHYRAGVVWRHVVMDSETDPCVTLYALGGFFAYMF